MEKHFINKCIHIPDVQFGFLSRGDTTLQLLRFTEYVIDKFNEPAYTAAKAYDTAWRT
jgi:hypothetical protein